MTGTNDKPLNDNLHTQPLDEHGVLLINLDASTTAVHDVLTEHISQTRAMLAVAYGHQCTPLQHIDDRLHDSYLWAMARQLQVIEHLTKQLISNRR